jgi:hypothetical protein
MATGFGFASIAAMHTARTSAAAVLLANGSQVLVTGGASSDGPFSAELYDDETGRWTPSEMTTARSGHTATLLKSGQVLVVGGDNTVDPSTAEVYTPKTNSWEKVFHNLNYPRIHHTATLLADGRVLVAGGSGAGDGSSLVTAEIFDPGDDPVNGAWTVINPMNDPRALHTATLLPNGTVLVAGGTTPFVPLSTAEVFDPATGVWSRVGSMNTQHAGHTATLLILDSSPPVFAVLVAGGVAAFNDDITSAAELYESKDLSWVVTGSMNLPRMLHTATLLPAASSPSGTPQVLVAGGADPGDAIASGMTTEIFDLGTGIWTYAGNMHAIRTAQTATMLLSGKVLVCGGGNNSAEVGAACATSAKIVVSPPQTIDFGQVQSGTANNSANFAPTVQNTGNAPLTLTVTISGPDAALFSINAGAILVQASAQTNPCMSGLPGPGASKVGVDFAAWSPVPTVCQAVLTLGGSNATNVPAGQTWVFPMVAEIVVSRNIAIEVSGPNFPETVVGEVETSAVNISLVSFVSEIFEAVVRFPPPPPHGAFLWPAGDYIVGVNAPVSVPITFLARGAGIATQNLELISNAQNSPTVVVLRGSARGGIAP